VSGETSALNLHDRQAIAAHKYWATTCVLPLNYAATGQRYTVLTDFNVRSQQTSLSPGPYKQMGKVTLVARGPSDKNHSFFRVNWFFEIIIPTKTNKEVQE